MISERNVHDRNHRTRVMLPVPTVLVHLLVCGLFERASRLFKRF